MYIILYHINLIYILHYIIYTYHIVFYYITLYNVIQCYIILYYIIWYYINYIICTVTYSPTTNRLFKIVWHNSPFESNIKSTRLCCFLFIWFEKENMIHPISCQFPGDFLQKMNKSPPQGHCRGKGSSTCSQDIKVGSEYRVPSGKDTQDYRMGPHS